MNHDEILIEAKASMRLSGFKVTKEDEELAKSVLEGTITFEEAKVLILEQYIDLGDDNFENK